MSKVNPLELQMRQIDKFMGDVMGDLSKLSIKAKPHGYETVIEINGYEFDCIVDYEIEKGCKGSRNEYGVPMEPDTQTVVNMGEVWIFDGSWQIVDIPEQAMTDTLAEILEEHI